MCKHLSDFSRVFRGRNLRRQIFAQRPRAIQSVSKWISGPLLIKKGPLHIPTSVTSPLRILGGMVNVGVSPNQVPEVPYYSRDDPCRVKTPFSLRIILSVPSTSTGEGDDKPEGRRIDGELGAKPSLGHLIYV